MNVPKNLKFTKEHEWISLEEDIATVGITDYAQDELGEVVFVEVETVGETLEQGDTFGSIEAVKTVSDLYLPVGGEIIELNEAIEDAPEKINEDPYNSGWIVKIKVADTTEFNNLLTAEAYQEIIS